MNNKLKELRVARGIDIEVLYSLLGIKIDLYKQYEICIDDLPTEMLYKLSIFYNVTCDYILDRRI